MFAHVPCGVDFQLHDVTTMSPSLYDVISKRAVLQTSDRSMSAKRLKQAVVKAALAKEGRTASKAERKALQEAMLAKVRP